MLPVKYVTMPEARSSDFIKNPFKEVVLRNQWAACVKCFDERHKDLVRIDRRDGRTYQSRGNAWATHFWRGFNGACRREHYMGSYDTLAYACWVAGRDISRWIKAQTPA